MADRNYLIQKNPDSQVESPLNVSPQPSDLELIRSAARGDGDAFHRLVDRHAKRLFRIALAMASSRSDAEDVLQETLMGAFQSVTRFNGKSSVKTWLTSILMRQAAKGWHRSRRSRSTLSIYTEHEQRDREDSAMAIESTAEDVDRRLDLATVLRELTPQHREIIVLREIEQMSYVELSQVLGLMPGTVESRLHRARLELRQRLSVYAT